MSARSPAQETPMSVHHAAALVARHATPQAWPALCLAAAAAAAVLAPAAAVAGRAQAGSTIGVYSSSDLDPASSTGTGWRDGGVVDTRTAVGDPASMSVQVHDGVSSAEVRLDAQGVLLDGGGGLAVSGHRAVRADLAAGALALSASTGYAGYTVPPNPYVHEAWVQGHSFAEVFDTYDIRWDIGRVEPVVLTLRMTIDGSITGNAGTNGRINAVNAFLGLGNIVDHDALAVLWSTETSVSGSVVTLTGSPISSQCNAVRGDCESFLGVYAALDLRTRALSGKDVPWGSGAPFAADFRSRIALDSSPGVTLIRTDNQGNAVATPAWVNAAPVPEPASALLLLAGAAGLGALARRSGAGR